MIPENYDEIMRPALARFCGWTWDNRTIRDGANELRYQRRTGGKDSLLDRIPDPLRYPERDAWALQCALAKQRPYSAGWFWWAGNHDEWHSRNGYVVHHCNTPELALVLAAYEVVREMEEEE